MNNIDIQKSNKHLINENMDFVLYFTATWCGPCKIISPEFDKISKENKFKDIFFYKIDVDENDDLCEEYQINCMPTFVFFKNKKKIESITGANATHLLDKLNTIFISKEDSKDSNEKNNSNFV
jgi:thioredoxin 1